MLERTLGEKQRRKRFIEELDFPQRFYIDVPTPKRAALSERKGPVLQGLSRAL
jgi:hypothetical protein